MKGVRFSFPVLLCTLAVCGPAWAQPTINVGPGLGTFPLGSIEYPLSASGGNGTYTWSKTAGSLPPGLSLRTDIPSNWTGVSAGIMGVATTPGDYSFTLQVTSGGQSSTQACTMRISGLNVKDGNLPDAFAGVPFSYTLTALGGAGSVTWTPNDGLPSWISLSSTGVLSGTPTSPGSYNVGFTISDGVDTVGHGVGFNVSQIQIPTAGMLPTATQNAAYNSAVTTSGGVAPYVFSSCCLPNDLSLDPASGVISGTVNGGPGKYNVWIQATDHNGASYQKNMSLPVAGAPPVLPGISFGIPDDCTVGSYCSMEVSVNQGVPPYSWTVTGLPAGMGYRSGSGITSSNVWPGDLELWGAPTAVGFFDVQVTLTDGGGNQVSQTFQIHVSNLQTDWQTNLPDGTRGVGYSQTQRVLGGVPPYSAQIVAQSLPEGLSLNGLTVSGTPQENGRFNVTYVFTDSAGSTLRYNEGFTIHSPTSPEIQINGNSDLGTAVVGQGWSNNLNACCASSWAWSNAGGNWPPGIGISNSGQLNGTPTAVGTYTFVVKAADNNNASNYALREFMLRVTPISITTPWNLTYGDVGTGYNGQPLTATGGVGTLTWAVVPGNYLPPGLSLNGATIGGTPTTTGQYSFQISVTDSVGNTQFGQFNVSIYAAGAAPPVGITNASGFGTFPIGSIEFGLVAVGGNGSYTWSVTSGSLPPGLALRTDIPSNWNWSPPPSAGILGVATTPGDYNFTLMVTSSGQSFSQACTMRITGLTLKDGNLPDAFVGVGYPPYTLTALGAGGPVAWTVNNGLPQGMSLSSVGVLSGAPSSPGNYRINVTFSDGLDTVGGGVSLSVSQVQITSAGMLPNATQNAAYGPYQLTAAGGVGSYTFSYNVQGGFPSGLSLSPSGAISGTANSGPGKWGVWVTATDQNSTSYTKEMSLTVVGTPPVPPAIAPYGGAGSFLTDCTVGSFCSPAVSVSDGAAPYSWNVTGLPPGMSARGGGVDNCCWPGDLELWGTPTQTGTWQAQVTATDATGASVTQTFPVHVSNLQTDWQTNLPDGTRGVAYSQTQRVLGGTAPYSAQIVGGLLPEGLSLNGLTVSGTPQENGRFNVTYLFTDSLGSTLRYNEGFTIHDPTSPEIDINSGSNLGIAMIGQGWSNNLNANCACSLTWSAAGGNWPPGIGISDSGQLSGTPTTTGTYTFVAQATDKGNASNYARQQFVLTVTPISITTSWQLPYGNVGTPYNNQTLTATGGVGSLTWALVPGNYLPPGLTLNGATIGGTPTSPGQYNFQISVTDSAGNTQIVQFNISIYPEGALPPVGISNAPDFGTFSIGEIQYGLQATGGNGTYTWTLANGSHLPPGLALRPDIAPWFNSSTSAEIGGVATTPGTYYFTLIASSGGNSTSLACSMKITALTLKDEYWLPDAFVGAPYNYQLTALNAAGPVTFTVPANQLPPGMNLSSSGQYAGTPTQAGSFNINVTYTDGVDTVNRNLGINVYTVQITSPGMLPNGTQSQPYSSTLTASGGSGPYQWTSNCLPGGLNLNSTTGLISGTLNTGPGRYTCQYTATDTNRVSYTKNMTLTVIGIPPVLPSLSVQSSNGSFDDLSLGVPLGDVLTINFGTPPFQWTVTGLPPGMDFRTGSGVTTSWVWPGDVELWGTPTVAGAYQVTATATDSTGATVTQTFPMRVVNLMVDGQDTLPNGTRDVAYARPGNPPKPPVVLRVLGGTGAYTAQLIAGAFPAGLTLNGSAMTVSGTPLENGYFNTTFRFTDSASNTLQNSQGFSIGGGTSTISINQNYNLGTVTVGTNYANQLGACCVPGYTWSVPTGSTLPPGLNLSQAGLLSGTPNTVGVYTFLVQVADSTNSANFGVRQFVLTVTPLSVSVSGSLPYGNVGTFYSQTLAATGGTGTLTWSQPLGSYLPPGLGLSTAGVLSGTPTTSGYFPFTITVSDSSNHVYTSWISLAIYPAGTLPPLYLNVNPNLGNYTLGTFTYQLWAGGGQPPYHFSLTPGATVVPGTRVQDGPPLPTNFPSNVTGAYLGVLTTPGTYTTSFRVTDNTGQTYDRAGTMTVSPLTLLDQYWLPHATVGAAYSYVVQPYPNDGRSYVFSATGLPAGLSIQSTTGVISGSPTAATANPSPTNTNITVTDTSGNTATLGFNIVVDPYAITTNGTLPLATANTAYTVTFNAPGCGSNCIWSTGSTSSTPGGSLPSFLSVPGACTSNPGTSSCTLTGTPTGPGNFTFTVTVNGSNGKVSQAFGLQVQANTPQPVFITTTSLPDVTVGSQTNLQLPAQGGTPPYTWTLASGTLPPGVRLAGPGAAMTSNANPTFWELAGRPMAAGTYNFTVQAKDSLNTTATQTLSWRISPLNVQYTNLPVTGSCDGCGTPLTYNVSYTQPLLVMGGSGNYTAWAANPTSGNPAGNLPAGLTLGAGNGVISGVPGETGSRTTPIQVTDDAGGTILQNVNFNIGSPSGTLVNFGAGPDLGVVTLGYYAVWNLNPSGGTSPYTIASVGPLPPGFAVLQDGSLLGNSNGSYSLEAMPIAAGTYTFTLSATDLAGNTGFRVFSVQVAPFELYTSTALADGSVGTPYSQTLLSFDNNGMASYSLTPGSALPPGLHLVGNALQGTPTTAGDYGFSLTVSDASGMIRSYGFALHVSTIAITDPQVLPQTAIVGVPFNYAFTATGGGTPKTWSATGLPNGLSMSANGTIGGTPQYQGESYLTVTVTDGASRVNRIFTLFVRQPNPDVLDYFLPAATLPDILAGQTMDYDLTVNLGGGIPPYTWSLASGSTLPPGVSLLTGAALSPSEEPGDTVLGGIPSTPGTYSFDLVATDSHGTAVRRTFTLRVTSMGLVSGNPKNGTVNVPYSVQLTAVGGTPPYTFTVSSLAYNVDYANWPMLPPGVTVTAAGLISGTPTSTGRYYFQVTVRDNAGATFNTILTWAINNTNGLRASGANPWDAPVGQFRSLCLLTSGSSSYTWSLVSGTLPPGMALVPGDQDCGAGTTMLAGRPTAPPATAVPYTFTLRATDKNNSSNFADHVYTMRVTPMQPLYHSMNLPPAQQGTAYSFTFRVAGGTPPYTFSVLPQVPLPPGLNLSPTGVLSGTPAASGNFVIWPAIQDANGYTLAPSIGANGGTLWALEVVPPGAPAPLLTNQDKSGGEEPSVGAPFVYRADLIVQPTGTPPYTWTMAPGSNLPPGLTILPGGNGISSYIAGIPTTPGAYSFTFSVTDSAGQTATVPVTDMPPLTTFALTPATVPPGTVGTTYSAALAPSGGTPPYNVSLAFGSDLPPGLTLSSAGVLSGTPTYPGLFQMMVTATDSASPPNSVQESYLATIDNATGQAPALSISPATVQLNFTLTGPSLAPVPIVIGTTSGSYPFTAMIGGIPGATLSATSGTAPATLYLNLDTSGLNSAATTAGVIAVSAPQSANGFTAIPVVLTVSTPPPCSYGLNPQSVNMPMEGGTGSFGVSTTSLCAWTPSVSDPGWITVTAGAGPGPGTVSYSVAANPPGQAARNGSITVAGQTYSIAQAGSVCSYAVSPTVIGATSTGGPATVSVTTSVAGCTWQASGASLNLSPTSGAGNGAVTLTVPVNNGTTAVQYTATVAGQTVTVNQAGQTPPPPVCTVGPNSGSMPAIGGSATFGVSDACGSWSASVSDASWISASPASAPGAATVTYTLAANPAGQPARTGSITIAGQVFSITQFGSSCTLSINPTSVIAAASGGSATVAVMSSLAGCPWTASGLNAAPSSGSGSGNVTVTIPANNAGTPQTLTAAIAGQTLTVNEAGVNCTVSLSAGGAQFAAAGGNGSVNVTTPAGCSYSTVGPSWISIGPPGSGVGPGTVTYTVPANSTTVPQSGTLTIGGQPYQISQAGIACSVTVDATGSGSPFGTVGGSGAIRVTANGPNCTWTASSGATWATVAPALGTGTGSINLSVTGNTGSASPRSTSLTIAGQTVGIAESGTTCTYGLSSANASVPAGGGNGSVGVIAPAVCTWSSITNNPDWLTIASSGAAGNSDVQFVAVANPNSTARTGSLTVAGQAYTVTQAAAPCSYALSASSAAIISDGGGGSFTFTSSAGGCPATAVSYSGWLHATPTPTGSNSGSVAYSVDANPTGSSRSGTIQVGDQTFTVTQAGAPCAFSLNEYGQEFDVNGTDVNGTQQWLTLLGSQSAAGCTPIMGASQPTIAGIGTLSGPQSNIYSLPFTVYPWVLPLVTGVRTANVTFGGQIFTVKQTSWAWQPQP